MRDQIKKLHLLTDMVKDMELSKLRNLQDVRLRIDQQRADLRKAQVLARSSIALDPAHLAGVDQRWHDWAEDKLHSLSVQDARTAAEIEAQKTAARKAFGRDQAVATLAKKLP
jgi:hypothetical protein